MTLLNSAVYIPLKYGKIFIRRCKYERSYVPTCGNINKEFHITVIQEISKDIGQVTVSATSIKLLELKNIMEICVDVNDEIVKSNQASKK